MSVNSFVSGGVHDHRVRFSHLLESPDTVPRGYTQEDPDHTYESVFDDVIIADTELFGKRTPVLVPRKSTCTRSSSEGGLAVCRICHSGEASGPKGGEPLISPCLCCGTMGLYHRTCLEQWLSSSNTTECEICKFQYPLQRTPKRFVCFLRNPGSRAARRNFIADIICFFILTPLAMSSSYLCFAGAKFYADRGKTTIEVPGLICLGVFLMLTYGVWLSVSLRYHYKLWQDWRLVNYVVTLRDHVLLDENANCLCDMSPKAATDRSGAVQVHEGRALYLNTQPLYNNDAYSASVASALAMVEFGSSGIV